MRKILIALAGLFVLGGVVGCTTAIYGQAFNLIPNHTDQYVMKVYVGGFSGGGTADNKAKAEINKFMVSHDYKSYKVINRTHHWVPSYFKYVVQFYKSPIPGI